MSEILTPDVCVIGAGSAGLTLAAAAAAFGASVLLIEKERMGGDCLNNGCVPSKALLAAARRAEQIRTSAGFGVLAGEPEVDFAAIMSHVRSAIAAIEPNDSVERFTGLGVTVIHGAARFTDPRTVAVGEARIRARRFVVATGSRPAIPAISNLPSVPYLTNENVFELKRRPSHLIIVGAGPIGLEMAQAFRRLGSQVTVLDAGTALARDDRELAALLLESLRSEGIEIREGVAIARVARRGRSGVRVTLEGEDPTIIDGSNILIAAGRRPEFDELGLQEARIAFDERGIKVNSRLRTRNRRVYAVGDVIGGAQFTHWGSYQAGLVVRSILFRFGGRMRPELLSWVTFTEPELAHVGLSEEEARRRYRKIRILRWPFAENDRAQTERAARGLVKLVTTKGGRVLGADILGQEAGELIASQVLAITEKMSVRTFIKAVFPYPTRSEAARRAALAFYAPKLDSPWLRWVARMLRKFG